MVCSFPTFVVGVVIAVSCGAAVVDARTGRIPNWLTLPAMLCGLVGHGIAHGRSALGLSLLGLFLTAFVPWALYQGSRGQAIGGGDVKLAAAIGALSGPMQGLQIEFAALLALAFLALARITYEGKLLRVLGNVLCLLTNPLRPRARRKAIAPESLTEMRMGPGIALGVVVVLASEHMARWLPWLA
ncbi:MAG TPA: A24 family peptidase [Polyangiaceae bacterium]|nr:A24 family peptidase [Polyangiaceae bacterium]